MNILLPCSLFLASFYSMLSRICPSIYPDDSPETIIASVTLGITHPPGDSVLALAGKIWTIVPLGNMAMRMNLLSAVFASLACLQAFRLVTRIFPGRLPSLAAAATLYALFIFNPLLVQQAAVAKGGVYTLNLVILLSAAIALQKGDNYSPPLIFGLLAAHHWMTFAAVSPVMGSWWAANLARSTRPKTSQLACGILFFLSGFSVLIYLPVRASQDPFLSWGQPSSLQRLTTHYLRKVYLPEEMRGTPLTWQRQAVDGLKAIRNEMGWTGLALACAGIPGLLSVSFLSLALPLLGALVPFLITAVYLDLRPELLHLLGIYLFPSWLGLAILASSGAAWLAGSRRRETRALALLLPALAAAALIPAGGIYNAGRSTWSYDVGRALLAPLPENAGILVTSDLDTFPLWYFQAVECCRMDVLVVNTTLMRHQWYREHIEGLSGVRRLRELENREAAIRYLVYSSRRFWFSAAGDIGGIPPELPRAPYYFTYSLGGGRPVFSFRGLSSRGIIECWSRLPEQTASISLDYITEVYRNVSRPAGKTD